MAGIDRENLSGPSYAVAAAVYVSLLAAVLTATVLYPPVMASLWMAFWG